MLHWPQVTLRASMSRKKAPGHFGQPTPGAPFSGCAWSSWRTEEGWGGGHDFIELCVAAVASGSAEPRRLAHRQPRHGGLDHHQPGRGHHGLAADAARAAGAGEQGRGPEAAGAAQRPRRPRRVHAVIRLALVCALVCSAFGAGIASAQGPVATAEPDSPAWCTSYTTGADTHTTCAPPPAAPPGGAIT